MGFSNDVKKTVQNKGTSFSSQVRELNNKQPELTNAPAVKLNALGETTPNLSSMLKPETFFKPSMAIPEQVSNTFAPPTTLTPVRERRSIPQRTLEASANLLNVVPALAGDAISGVSSIFGVKQPREGFATPEVFKSYASLLKEDYPEDVYNKGTYGTKMLYEPIKNIISGSENNPLYYKDYNTMPDKLKNNFTDQAKVSLENSQFNRLSQQFKNANPGINPLSPDYQDKLTQYIAANTRDFTPEEIDQKSREIHSDMTSDKGNSNMWTNADVITAGYDIPAIAAGVSKVAKLGSKGAKAAKVAEEVPKLKISTPSYWTKTAEELNQITDPIKFEPITPNVKASTVPGKFTLKNVNYENAVNKYNDAIQKVQDIFGTNELRASEIPTAKQILKEQFGYDIDSIVNDMAKHETYTLPSPAEMKLKRAAGVASDKQYQLLNDLAKQPKKPLNELPLSNNNLKIEPTEFKTSVEVPKGSSKLKIEPTEFKTTVEIPKEPTFKDKISETVQGLLKNSHNWKDKSMPFLQRETWDRNIIDIAGKNDGQKLKEYLIDPIHKNESHRIQWMNNWRKQISDLKLTKKESELVHKYGEGKISLDEIKTQYPSITPKLENAVNTFRKFYNEALDLANEGLAKNGYDKVGKLDNYFPHFQGDDVLAKALGVNLDLVDLPTDINGLTHQFKPGKNFFGNFLKRTGDKTTYDAVQGFDRYIEGISKVIFHTDDIQKLRSFNRELRLKYSSEGVAEQVGKIMNSKMPEEAKNAAIEQLIGGGRTHLSNMAADLEEFTNVLAGKKDLADRASERWFGRQIYNISNRIINKVGKNMVALNPASWITNFIPITQSLATTDKASSLQALLDTMRNIRKNDGFTNQSTFLTNRIGSDILGDTSYTLDELLKEPGIRGKYEAVKNNIGTSINKTQDVLTRPFKWIDNFTSQVVTRSKYIEGLKNGLSPEEALKAADEWAAKIMGDRSLGATPTLFNQRNPLTKLFTQFQLEVNNQISFMLKDMPREYLKTGKNAQNVARLTSAVGQLAIYSFVFNEIYKQITGRRPAFDPIGVAWDFVKDMGNDNLKKSDAVANLGKNSIQQLPFINTLVGGGRLPISVAMPNFGNIGNALAKGSAGEQDTGQTLTSVGKELINPLLYVAPPFGGGQIKKTYEGLNTVNNGGEYITNSKGEKQLRYPVDKSFSNYLKAILFGKSALPENQNYYNNKMAPLSGNQTQIYDSLGQNPEYYNSILEDRKTKKLIEELKRLSQNKQ